MKTERRYKMWRTVGKREISNKGGRKKRENNR
jgi:hypothetical protein